MPAVWHAEEERVRAEEAREEESCAIKMSNLSNLDGK
jgi:hypothetical protein